jgi:hypothetical protein
MFHPESKRSRRKTKRASLRRSSARSNGYRAAIGLEADDMALTVPQLQSNLDAINQALGNPTLKVRFPDGREVTYRSVDELRKAKAEIEEDIRQASGKSGSRTTLAQHKRGDGPGGPSLYDRW